MRRRHARLPRNQPSRLQKRILFALALCHMAGGKGLTANQLAFVLKITAAKYPRSRTPGGTIKGSLSGMQAAQNRHWVVRARGNRWAITLRGINALFTTMQGGLRVFKRESV